LAQSVSIDIDTLEPGRVLKALIELETLLGVRAWIRVEPDNPLAEALHRIREDLVTPHPIKLLE
jgi:hypothetical protein